MKACKKLLLGLTALMLAFGFVACDGGADSSSSDVGGSLNSSSDESSILDDSSVEDSSSEDSGEEIDEAAVAIVDAAWALAENEKMEGTYTLTGTITELGAYNASYGDINVTIVVAGREDKPMYCYALKGAEAGQLMVGDVITVEGSIKNYKGTAEFDKPQLIAHKEGEGHQPPDESDYAEMSIEDARTAAKGALVKVDGVVARITYAFGMKPNGVYLVDETQSIYVYDVNFASMVSIGNTVTILAEKDYWILEDEQGSASKFGYQGCNQLTNVQLVSNDKGNTEFNKDWIPESTVKDILDNPVNEDITTTIYKVNALVHKAEGSNFINYYFNDLDGETGSYTYTQCSGSDFAWLDAFDGKICTVYLSVINAKSTATGCVYRFVPIAVQDDGYKFDVNDTAEFVVKYYGVGSIGTSYTGDPALELTTQVSSDLLGFAGAEITYSSDNQNVVDFSYDTPGAAVMHCGEPGTANVTVSCTYNNVTYSEKVTVTVSEKVEVQAITVAEAITAAVDSEVTVKGIVGPSVVNKSGFYLFGNDGNTIAVLVNSTDEFVGLEIGHEIVIKGTRERYVKDDASTIAGQSCIVNATILANYYGEHEYSTAKFVESTAAEFYDLDKTVDYSTTVFVITATVNYIDKGYYTTLSISAGGVEVGLYMSGAGQYSWLADFAGQEVTMEIAACNWNDKNFWRGCVLAVRTADGKILNTLNFDTY